MNGRSQVALILLAICLGSLFSCTQHSDKKLRIATAANMQFAIQQLTADFTARTGIECELVISSSGKLTAQIKEGAPYDLFVAADMNYPQAIYEAGFAQQKPEVYAYGKLVLWSYNDDSLPLLRMLTDSTINHIAIANPRTAPYGSAAIAILNAQKLYDSISHKLVFGESISQTNQFITSGAADIGFTALAVVKSTNLKNKGNWAVIDQSLYDPIAQGVVILKRDKKSEKDAQAFYSYLFSAEGQNILKDFGYSVDE